MKIVEIEGNFYEKPTVRSECLPGGCNEERPCPWVSCRYHLCVHSKGKSVYEDREVDDGLPTCVLDVADEDCGMTLEQIATYMGGQSRERMRQIDEVARYKFIRRSMHRGFGDEMVETANPRLNIEKTLSMYRASFDEYKSTKPKTRTRPGIPVRNRIYHGKENRDNIYDILVEPMSSNAIRNRISELYNISRRTVMRHIAYLLKSEKIIKIGRGTISHNVYIRADSVFARNGFAQEHMSEIMDLRYVYSMENHER